MIDSIVIDIRTMARNLRNNRGTGTPGNSPANPPMPNFANDGERQRALEQMMLTLGAAYQRQVERDEAQAATAAPQQVDYLEQINKYKPPTYGGQEDPTQLEHWIETMDKLLGAVRCPDERMVEVAIFYLTGIATTWWRSLENPPNN